MDNRKRKALTARVVEEYHISEAAAKKQAEDILRIIPAELEVNLEEWLAGRELTAIHIAGYSIPMLFGIWGRKDFLWAVRILAELKTDRDTAERRIWRMRG